MRHMNISAPWDTCSAWKCLELPEIVWKYWKLMNKKFSLYGHSFKIFCQQVYKSLKTAKNFNKYLTLSPDTPEDQSSHIS